MNEIRGFVREWGLAGARATDYRLRSHVLRQLAATDHRAAEPAWTSRISDDAMRDLAKATDAKYQRRSVNLERHALVGR